jgi:hypothetical protein
MKEKKVGIKTQQGFYQFTIWLPPNDAKIYTDLLERNFIWYYNITTGYKFVPDPKKQYPPEDLDFCKQ